MGFRRVPPHVNAGGIQDKLAKAARYRAIFAAGFALLYGASPVDVIPDVIPVLGLLDDALVVPAFLVLAYFQFRKARRLRTALPPRVG